jgi:outer membrane protein assembly factor BamA
MKTIVLFAYAVYFLYIAAGHCQTTADSIPRKKDCQPKELGEILFKKSNPRDDTTRKKDVFLLPYVAYSPTKGFQLGVGGTFSWYKGKSRITNQSAASATAEFTSKNQKLFQMKTNIYTDLNKWFLQGDWRYYIYSIPTYGLGTGYGKAVPEVPGVYVPADTAPGWDQSFQVKFRWLKIHEIFLKMIVENLYAGIGVHFDYHFKIEDEDLSLDSASQLITPHYAYSTLHGFDPEEYISSGFSVNFVFDTRDNLINPYKGYYAKVSYRMNPTWLGSAKTGSQLWTEFRTYIGLERKLPRHLIAFWYYGAFQVSGDIPYFDLWATGFDQMNSSGRGYLQGRWRGENLVYSEVEYRFPITRCSQVLGGVLFFNASTASDDDKDVPLFGYIRPAGGAGLRIMVSKVSRTNISVDFTVAEKSLGIYFSAQEVF